LPRGMMEQTSMVKTHLNMLAPYKVYYLTKI
jgi:hypothetical protein